MEQNLNDYLAALEVLFHNLNNEAARAWWTSKGYAPPIHPTVPLATVHKARLQWLDATDDMRAESRAFLLRPRLRRRPQHPPVHVEDPIRRASEVGPCAVEAPTGGRI